MSFISGLAAALVEWIIAKLTALGLKQYQQYESDQDIKDEALKDVSDLASAKDLAGRVSTLEKIVHDTLNDDSSKPK